MRKIIKNIEKCYWIGKHFLFKKIICIYQKALFKSTYILKVTLCWNIFFGENKIVYFSWHFLAQKCLRINDLLFSPPYTIYYSQFPSVKIVNGVSVWCQRLWRPNLQKCEEQAKSKAGQALLQARMKKKYKKKQKKVIKLSNFLHEKDIFHLPD